MRGTECQECFISDVRCEARIMFIYLTLFISTLYTCVVHAALLIWKLFYAQRIYTH
jgi:hypothetical protein